MDTLKYRFKTKLPSQRDMERDGLTQKRYGFYKNIKRDKCILKLQTSNNYGREYVNVEVSVPKLLYGSNVAMVAANDLEYVNDSVTEIIANETPCIPFEAGNAEITRLDFAYNFLTGSESNAHAYRDAVKCRTLPYLTRSITAKKNNEETVFWKNDSQKIVIYPKFAETKRLVKNGKASVADLEKALGMLRFEHRQLTPKAVGNLLKKYGYTNRADDVVPRLLEMTHDLLRRDMEKLGLDRPIEILGERERADLLLEGCKDYEQFNRLLGFLNSCDLYGENNLVSLGMNIGTFGKRKREVERLGIALTKSDRRYVLPALSIPHIRFNKTNISSTGSIIPTLIDNDYAEVGLSL